jgi:hypothetical protein
MTAFLSAPLRAQVLYGSVVGTVTDNTGAAVPDAAVLITNTQTNDARTVQTTLPEGPYVVNVTKQGFEGFKATSIAVTANNVVRVDAQLSIGAVSQTVEVQAALAAQLQTDTADVHAEISNHALENVPQATRSYQGILNQVPGMVPQ